MLASFFSDLSALEKVYVYSAIVGGAIFLIRLVLMFIGGDFGDSETEGLDGADGSDGFNPDTDVDDLSDTDMSFRLLSIQGLSAFGMMFGLVGMTVLKQTTLGATWSVFGGCAAGAAMVWVVKKLFEMARGLQSSGTLNLKEYAVGSEGTVYLTIPDQGTGKVRVTVQNHLKVFEARSEQGEEIKTGEDIKVVGVVSNNILLVNKRKGASASG